MKLLTDQVFQQMYDRGEQLDISRVELRNCMFNSSGLSMTTELASRSTVRDAFLKDCIAHNCTVGPAHLQNVLIENLRTDDLLIVWGATFDRVTFQGDIGKLKLNTMISITDRSPEAQAIFDAERSRIYNSIEWAIDISNARFKEFDFRGIPARLVRRDPATQMVVTRERALASGWQEKLNPSNKLWPFMIRLFLSDGVDDAVFVAPMGAPKRKRDMLLGELHELQDLGVLEPN